MSSWLGSNRERAGLLDGAFALQVHLVRERVSSSRRGRSAPMSPSVEPWAEPALSTDRSDAWVSAEPLAQWFALIDEMDRLLAGITKTILGVEELTGLPGRTCGTHRDRPVHRRGYRQPQTSGRGWSFVGAVAGRRAAVPFPAPAHHRSWTRSARAAHGPGDQPDRDLG